MGSADENAQLRARVEHLDRLCEGFSAQVKAAVDVLQRIETTVTHAAEELRKAELPSDAQAMTDAVADLARVRRALAQQADRFLKDTQPIDVQTDV